MNVTIANKQHSDSEAPETKSHQLAAGVSRLRLPSWTVINSDADRRTVNLLLLIVVMSALLLSLALAYAFTAFSLGVVPVLSVVVVSLAALAAGITWWSSRQYRIQSVNSPPLAISDPAGDSMESPGVTAQEVSQRLVAVQESVRRDMADYLHGHVQSKLLALSMSLSTCQKLLARDPAHAYHLLESIQAELQRVQDEDLRQVSRELYPAIIKMGLVPAIRSLISRFSDLLEIDLIIDADIFALDAAGEARLPEKQRLGIYRIAEEALNNVLKHAKANHVEVNLICDVSDRLVLLVTDDGRGFDPLAVNNSHGLVMMSDYAEAIGGKAEINSSIGQGTSVNLIIPLKSPGTSAVAIAGSAQAQLSKEF